MSEKSKKRLPHFSSEIHIILQEDREAVEDRLMRLAEKDASLQLQFDDFANGITKFELQQHRNNRITARVRGRLLRWQGTETRLDCRGEIRSHGLWLEMGWLVLIFSLSMMVWGAVVASWMSIFGTSDASGLLPLLVVVMIALASTRWVSRMHLVSRLTETREYNERVDMDYLMQLMMQVVTASPGENREAPMDIDKLIGDKKSSVISGADGELIHVTEKKQAGIQS